MNNSQHDYDSDDNNSLLKTDERLFTIKRAAETLGVFPELIEILRAKECINFFYREEDDDQDYPFVYLSDVVEGFESWTNTAQSKFENYKASECEMEVFQ